MTLRAKGSRRITVDGVSYRWHLRGRPTYSQGLCWSPCTYAVEHLEHPGATLVVNTNQVHPANFLGRPSAPILPSDVARSIRLAVERGWHAESPGPPFLLDLSAGLTPSG